jgi:hypothetical protein
MAGYGNRTAPDYVADDLSDQHESTRLGLTDSHGAYSNPHPKYGSGATGGAGFGTSLIYPYFPEPAYPTISLNLCSEHKNTGLVYVNTNTVDAGNKSDSSTVPTSNDEFRFDLHKDTSPYSGAAESRAGSGSTGGAGYGNKTGEFGPRSGGTLCRIACIGRFANVFDGSRFDSGQDYGEGGTCDA